MNTVLLLDKSYKLSSKITDTLFRKNINAFRLSSEEQCVWEASRLSPVGIIVALASGGSDQATILRALVRHTKVPVIIASESRIEADELTALEMGASAFLDGGASSELIGARILHALKFNGPQVSDRTETKERRVIQYEHLELDIDAHIAKWRGQYLEVTCREMSLLISLIQRPGVVKSRNSLIDEAYPDNIHVDERTIDSHMKRLRAKLRELDPSFDQIQSVYGVGYRFRVDQRNSKQVTKPSTNVFASIMPRQEEARAQSSLTAYGQPAGFTH